MLEGGGGATGLLNKGGGSNRLPGLVNNKLWNFHRYFLVSLINVPYISELKQGTNRSLVSFTSLVISSDNVNRGLVLLLLLCLIYKPGHN